MTDDSAVAAAAASAAAAAAAVAAEAEWMSTHVETEVRGHFIRLFPCDGFLRILHSMITYPRWLPTCHAMITYPH